MEASTLVDEYLRLQSALVGFVTPSLVSVSFDLGSDGETRVRLIYRDSITSEDERMTIAALEKQIRQSFEARATTEVVFLREADSSRMLAWPIFLLRKPAED